MFTPELMVQRLARSIRGSELDGRAATTLSVVMRAVYGPGWAIAWGLVRGNHRLPPIAETVLLATLMSVFEMSVLPAVGATPPLRSWPARDMVADVIQCLVFSGVVTTCARVSVREPDLAE